MLSKKQTILASGRVCTVQAFCIWNSTQQDVGGFRVFSMSPMFFQVSEVQSWKTLPCSRTDSMTSRKMSRIVRTHPHTLCWRWSFPSQQSCPKEWLCPTNVSRPWQNSRDPPLSLDAKQTDGQQVDKPAEVRWDLLIWMLRLTGRCGKHRIFSREKELKISSSGMLTTFCWGVQSNHHLKNGQHTWQNPSLPGQSIENLVQLGGEKLNN